MRFYVKSGLFKKMIKNFNKYIAFLTAGMVICADQAVKGLVSQNMLLNEKINVLNNYLSITKLYNSGAAFGIFQDGTLWLAGFSLVIILGVVLYIMRNWQKLDLLTIIAWGLVLGGTAGNMIDRLTLGYVLDFISFDFINFPICNLADISINIGAVLLIFHMFFHSEHTEHSHLHAKS